MTDEKEGQGKFDPKDYDVDKDTRVIPSEESEESDEESESRIREADQA
jgi:hypothetical protein